jgi:hypothetical protein
MLQPQERPAQFLPAPATATTAVDRAQTLPVADVRPSIHRRAEAAGAVADSRGASSAAADQPADWLPNRAALWGVPIAAGIVLLYALRLVLGAPLLRVDG